MPAKVCLRANFCPVCFRGPDATVTRVGHDNGRVDNEQRQCSLATRGLPLLDLAAEGGRCEKLCTMTCLACGNPMAFPCESEYQEAFDAIDRFEEEEIETRGEVFGGFLEGLGRKMLAAAEHRLQGRLAVLGMAWHPRWRKAVHRRCLKKNTCGCLLSFALASCPTHIQTKPLPPRTPRNIMTIIPAPPQPVERARATPGRPVVMFKASWMPRPSAAASICAPPPVVVPSFSAPAMQRKLQKPKPKPNPRLESAARGCRSLDNWGAHSEPSSDKRLAPPGARPGFDMRKYDRESDPFKHGYFRKNGEDMFLFPDGWVERVTSSVNQITEDGRLVPG